MVIPPDTRNIKLTLSAPCYYRLQSDSSIFGFALSHVIGTVICDYCEWAEMIAREGRSPQQALFDKAAKGEELRFFKTISRLIFHGGRRHVSKESRIYNWTITKDARHALGSDTLSKNETYSFVAEILEEYSEMNYSLREKIMLRNTISVIDRAVSGEKAEIISYKTRHGNTRKIVPYKIITEPDTQYNYLVGNFIEDDGSIKTGCARIFSMNGVYGTGKEEKIDTKTVEQLIAGRNIAYISAEECDIEIGLTPAGEHNFNLVIHNRPVCVGRGNEYVNGYKTYRFHCTTFQAKVYFRSFGKDAKPLSPAVFVSDMKKFYEDAISVFGE